MKRHWQLTTRRSLMPSDELTLFGLAYLMQIPIILSYFYTVAYERMLTVSN
jgi:hypothetical protein